MAYLNIKAIRTALFGAINGLIKVNGSGVVSAAEQSDIEAIYTPPAHTGLAGTTSTDFTVDSDSALGKIKLAVVAGAADKTLTLTNEVLTDNRTATIPNKTGTLAMTTDIPDITGKVDKETGKSLVADTEISKIHSSGTDQGLDTGGTNAVTAAQAKAGYTHSGAAHAPTDAVSLATVKGDTDVADAISKKHASGSDAETAATIAAGRGAAR